MQITENELLQELAQALLADSGERRPGDVTIADLVAATGRHPDAIRAKMAAEVAAGRLQCRWIRQNGKRVVAYYR